MLKSLCTLLVCAALAACATARPLTPSQRVYAITSDYDAALALAVAYKNLTPCPGPTLCSDSATVGRIRMADNAAYAALKAAQDHVRSGTSPATVEADVAAAQTAVLAFSSIANSVKVK